MKADKRDPQVLAIIDKAEEAFRAPSNGGLPTLYRGLGACASSSNADIALITWFYLYHYGQRPLYVRPSRGHTYRVTMRAGECKVRTVDSFDHREGVEEIRSA